MQGRWICMEIGQKRLSGLNWGQWGWGDREENNIGATRKEYILLGILRWGKCRYKYERKRKKEALGKRVENLGGVR